MKCPNCHKEIKGYCGEKYCPYSFEDIRVSDVSVDPDLNNELRKVPYGDKPLKDFIFKPKKKFSWDKVKRISAKVIDNPITRTLVEFTPKPVRVGFTWINKKLIQNDMIKDKKWYQSKTVWSAILLVLTAILQALGVDVAGSPEVMTTIYEVLYVLAGAFGLFGLRSAIGDKINKDK